ncbi:acyl-CoA dehydrogenase family protein [Candidatus Syntrophosphaera thermopropionivorans]|jgi:alkylation response protein AidB-like acyl-CoA dehydrogenase|uniref:Acyl-CoA dehydrogenase n=1 Tax=Candidatus Syntrophosphaera thermopropionivorans TaxID=2593015 RepID=A0AC61QJG3_9BACT|nr:acyl-CoA dehydrogenase family protein [Candidatus Syntrophosphaera thermopropionivorans]TDF73268.1 acyl-CoA dehydrogenase [Candidatus Syntrophosphaera thermopropionivorans]HPW25236.1 acyl-CoA dehydrogenase family protein [Candidatus Syntrophosphaera thermopropionivorans]HPX63419.1 acyl-CoA dehydrogenase family protein [Candidatus Syntrophosphaera thermopropionivorans]HRD00389.1 acyl-CoA dehydrogenase family protein [Candidatus Syntrophosphaera thermopropionivorans]
MNYFLTEEQLEMQEIARRIANEKMKPVSQKYDEEGIFPWDIVEVMRQSDLFAILVGEEYGGISGKVMDLAIVTEELCAVDMGISLAFGATGLGMYPILIAGSEEQKQKYLTQIAAGEKLAAFALTEANAGSDAGAIETTARKEGDHYILNGTKQWITNGGEADIYCVFAMTDKTRGARGCSCFIVEKGTPGFNFGKKENKMGIRASATRELIFEDCIVPAENLIGREGMGFIIAMKVFDKSRPMVGAQAVGVARGAFETAITYSKQRQQFGKPISSFQAIQFMLADMATEIEAARALVYQTARLIDSGAKDYSKESAMCKYFASDVAMKVTTDAVQVLGGYGYMKEYPVEKMMRDAKILQIYEGTNQIQRGIVASALLKQY